MPRDWPALHHAVLSQRWPSRIWSLRRWCLRSFGRDFACQDVPICPIRAAWQAPPLQNGQTPAPNSEPVEWEALASVRMRTGPYKVG
ncbi:hypothetical protein ACRALDRAFT_2035768 [Sodiomyces alcalophilus JCM 7366]|uniref:uncharacterized protein n=1 Tax=Sodiomyces alcalophilus JCM 7366 TaxID=591952 RepID=UPI0039B49218